MYDKIENGVFVPNRFRWFFYRSLTAFPCILLGTAIGTIIFRRNVEFFSSSLIHLAVIILTINLVSAIIRIRKYCSIEIREGFVEGKGGWGWVRTKFPIEDIDWHKSFKSAGFKSLFKSNYICSNSGDKIYLDFSSFTGAQSNSIKEILLPHNILNN